jgi:hypothetical protein
MVERRLQALDSELAELRRANHSAPVGSTHREGVQDAAAKRTTEVFHADLQPLVSPAAASSSVQLQLPNHLLSLRDVLVPSFHLLMGMSPTAAGVSVEEASLLWELQVGPPAHSPAVSALILMLTSFYEHLAIYHGFIPHSQPETPSPLLLASIAAASAQRATGSLALHAKTWIELFHRAVSSLLSEVCERTWDDVVGLCIARTWYWKSNPATSGLIYGQFLATLSPASADVRSRRVWDFMNVSRGSRYLRLPRRLHTVSLSHNAICPAADDYIDHRRIPIGLRPVPPNSPRLGPRNRPTANTSPRPLRGADRSVRRPRRVVPLPHLFCRHNRSRDERLCEEPYTRFVCRDGCAALVQLRGGEMERAVSSGCDGCVLFLRFPLVAPDTILDSTRTVP